MTESEIFGLCLSSTGILVMKMLHWFLEALILKPFAKGLTWSPEVIQVFLIAVCQCNQPTCTAQSAIANTGNRSLHGRVPLGYEQKCELWR
jgi:hypothetical protein